MLQQPNARVFCRVDVATAAIGSGGAGVGNVGGRGSTWSRAA